ncbi:MAG: DNA cytosine methyltransferase [Acidimicrobiales bacterium]
MSLFSNCGAGDIGFAQAGFTFEVMAEIDLRRLDVALLNHRGAIGIPGDLRHTLPQVVAAYRERAGDERPALLAACPPCQGLSSAQSARGDAGDPDVGSRDRRNLLVSVIEEAVRRLRPRALVVENVQAFLTRQVRLPVTNEPVSAARFLIESLSADYEAFPILADLADFGVPQSRKRSFLTFFHKDEAGLAILHRKGWSPYPWPSHASGSQRPVTLEEALRAFALPPLDAIAETQATSDIEMHTVPVWPADRYRMISAIPPHSGRSAWENDSCIKCGRKTRDRARVRCSGCGTILPRPIVYGKKPGDVPRLISGFHTSYRRMDPALPAATVTTASGHLGSDRTVHPWENRVLSPLECALLQTFPGSFQWGDSMKRWGHTNVRIMIGEAVPPLFTRKHGRVLAQLLQTIPPRLALAADDHRVTAAQEALRRSARHVEADAASHTG